MPSFAWEHRDKGVEFGHKLKSPRTILLVRGWRGWAVVGALRAPASQPRCCVVVLYRVYR